jgi:MFS family permease
MQSAALMWLVYARTNDAAWPARMLVASVGPTLILGPFGGALADRLPKRWLVFRTQIAFMLTALMLALVTALNLASPWWLVGVQLVTGIIQSIDVPARLAYVPELVPRTDLINAVSLNSLLFNSGRVLGPALAGIVFLVAGEVWSFWHTDPLAVHWKAATCFLLNALSFAAVLMALSRIQATGASLAKQSELSLAGGVRYVLRRPVLALLLILTGILSIFGWPILTLLPAYTRTALAGSEGTYTTLLSGLGCGAFGGALLTASFSTAARRGYFLTAGGTLATIGFAGMTQASSVPTAMLPAAALGMGLVVFLSTAQSALQLAVDPSARGRVMALWAMTLSASAPLGHLFAGELAQTYGVLVVLQGMTAGVGMVAVVVLIRWCRRGWATPQESPRESSDY